jgi:hypothetical protein
MLHGKMFKSVNWQIGHKTYVLADTRGLAPSTVFGAQSNHLSLLEDLGLTSALISRLVVRCIQDKTQSEMDIDSSDLQRVGIFWGL